MVITDAQVHIWQPDATRPGSGPSGRGAGGFSAEQLLCEMDSAGVDRAILVPSTFWMEGASEYALAAAAANPSRLAVVDHFDPGAEDARARLETFGRGSLLGLRLLFRMNQRWLDDSEIDWLFAACERLQIPIMAWLGGMAGKLRPVAVRHPGLPIIIDHMDRLPNKKGAEAFAALGELLSLSDLPNIAVKMTAVPACSNESYPFNDVKPYLERIHEAFDARRLMWGSDLPGLPCPYRQCLDLFLNELDFFSAQDLEWVLGGTAASLLAWPATEPGSPLAGTELP